ncbi:MAG: TRAP transporter substrate-binding protein DctP [Deltaproteobacteria bacterium]|jgi:TRAP-type C4-dicarboxylate transport system substrate-binding protein
MIRSAVIKIAWLGLITMSLTMLPATGVAKMLQIKIATLAPEGSSWIKTFHSIDEEVRTKTDKQVGFKFYPGGVLGDEKDMLRKMHIGQINGAALTSAGLSAIYGEMDVFQIPFLFKSHREVDYILEEMNAFFQKGLEENGYILLGWSEGGFVRLMSTVPVATLDDLRKVKVWTWEGSPMTKAIFDQANVSAIPLTVPDVLVGLQTGLVDVVYAPPSGAISLQWFTKIKYMTDVKLIYLIGGLVMQKKVFNKISPDHQKILLETCRRRMNELKATIRKENQEAIQVMVKHGVKIITPTAAQVAEFVKVSDQAMQRLEGKSFSKKIRDEVTAKIDAYRKKNPQ